MRENKRFHEIYFSIRLSSTMQLFCKSKINFSFQNFSAQNIYLTIDVIFYFRLEWESAILRGCSSFRRMEDDRLSQLRFLAEQYQQILEDHRPKLVASANRLDEPIRRIHVGRDMEVVRKKVKKNV